MALVAAKCTQCGAELEVDNTQEAAVCRFCGTAFIVEKAINNYSIQNTNYISADTISLGETADKLDFAGKQYLDLDNYLEAEKVYVKLSMDYPSDYRGPVGLIHVYSHNFKRVIDPMSDDWQVLIDQHNKVHALAPQDVYDEINKKVDRLKRYSLFELDKLRRIGMLDADKQIVEGKYNYHKNLEASAKKSSTACKVLAIVLGSFYVLAMIIICNVTHKVAFNFLSFIFGALPSLILGFCMVGHASSMMKQMRLKDAEKGKMDEIDGEISDVCKELFTE